MYTGTVKLKLMKLQINMVMNSYLPLLCVQHEMFPIIFQSAKMAVDVTKQPPPVPIDNTIDIEKISSSHFTVGHDFSVIKDTMKSIFKLDFPCPAGSGKTLPSDPPVLGQVMHKDTKFFKDNTSETINSFQYRHLPKPDLQYDHDTIGQTNFKMDSDVKKIDSFKTIHRLHFPPLVDEGCAVVRPPRKGDWHPSCIPQGDPSKEHQQLSDYKEKFQGHDTSVVKVPRITSQDSGRKFSLLHLPFYKFESILYCLILFSFLNLVFQIYDTVGKRKWPSICMTFSLLLPKLKWVWICWYYWNLSESHVFSCSVGELSTVKGDKRMVNFTTSSMDTFRGRWLPRVPAVPVVCEI